MSLNQLIKDMKPYVPYRKRWIDEYHTLKDERNERQIVTKARLQLKFCILKLKHFIIE